MIRLVPMGTAEFQPYLEATVREYAADSARAGRWNESEAESEARKQIQGLLPSGLASPGQHLFSIVAEPAEERVGVVWVAIEPRGAFIYDLRVFEAFRGRGYGEGAMRALEPFARSQGAQKLLLHVFGTNAVARRLYQRLGYAETNVMMAKSLDGPE